MDAFRATYRGYYIYIVRKSDRWSFWIAPSTPDLPILGRPSLPRFASIETAMREARNRIDRVVALCIGSRLGDPKQGSVRYLITKPTPNAITREAARVSLIFSPNPTMGTEKE